MVIPITLAILAGDVLRDVVVHPGHRRVHADRRIVRRRARQFRSQDRAGRRGRVAHRLHGHGCRADVCGDCRAYLGVSDAGAMDGGDHVGVTLLMLFANLRGIREAGSFFAIPTYFYIGIAVDRGGDRPRQGGARRTRRRTSCRPLSTSAIRSAAQTGCLMGLGVFYCLKAFANGGVSLTGLEAVSDGISSFRETGGTQRSQGTGDHVPDPRIPRAGDVASSHTGPMRSRTGGHADGGLAGGALRPRFQLVREGLFTSCRRPRC